MVKITRGEAYNLYTSLSRKHKREMTTRLGFTATSGLTNHLRNPKYTEKLLAPDKLVILNNMLDELGINIDDYRYEQLNFVSAERYIKKCESTLELNIIEDKLDMLILAIKLKKAELMSKESM